MYKLILLFVVTAIATEAAGKFIHPTYRPPSTRPPTYRFRRSDDSQPQWLYSGDVPRAPASGDHPVLPQYIDSVKLDPNSRYARSVDSPSAKRGGGSHSSSSGSRDTGATHPGYNRRNARSLEVPSFLPPLTPFRLPNPLPIEPLKPFPSPTRPIKPYPIYA